MDYLFYIVILGNILSSLLLLIGLKRAFAPRNRIAIPTPPSISLLIAIKNEVQHLPTLFECLEKQTYQPLEIILVNDHSSDGSRQLLEEFCQTSEIASMISLPEGVTGKKQALTYGIDKATATHLMFTDADCLPPSRWIESVATEIDGTNNEILVGYSPMVAQEGLLQSWQQYDTLQTAVLTASAIGWHKPYMAVGRNLSYPKELFLQTEGYGSHLDIRSGDDDLFLQSVKEKEVVFLSNPNSIVPTLPAPSLSKWIRQKKRHFSAGTKYPLSTLFILGLFRLFHLFLWILPCFFEFKGFIALILLFPLHLLPSLYFANKMQTKLNSLLVVLSDFVYLLSQLLLPVWSVFIRKDIW